MLLSGLLGKRLARYPSLDASSLETIMRRVLAISSFVSKGSVGLQATVPALVQVDIEPIAVPTIVLSNHPGFKETAGTAIACDTLNAMLDAFDANGWLAAVDAIFTGYFPTAEHVHFARDAVQRVKSANPAALFLADPIIGDDPDGLYVGFETATAIRKILLPLADITTPNRFELAWLSGQNVVDRDSALAAARHLGVPLTAVTSVPEGTSQLANILVSDGVSFVETINRMPDAPHGTGDYFAGAFLAQILQGSDRANALSKATRMTERVVLASQGSSDLVFADS